MSMAWLSFLFSEQSSSLSSFPLSLGGTCASCHAQHAQHIVCILPHSTEHELNTFTLEQGGNLHSKKVCTLSRLPPGSMAMLDWASRQSPNMFLDLKSHCPSDGKILMSPRIHESFIFQTPAVLSKMTPLPLGTTISLTMGPQASQHPPYPHISPEASMGLGI